MSRSAALLPPPVRRVVRHQLVWLRHRGLRREDALLVSYPKSGSTWLRFLLAHVLTDHHADFDSIRDTVPPVGRHRGAPALLPSGGRVIRSHEPLSPTLGRCGRPVVYLVRDGRDVALSYLDHQRRYLQFDGELDAFLDLFLSGQLDGYGTWDDHVAAALEFGRSTPGPFLMVKYEDLRTDPVGQLARVVAFLGVTVEPARLAEAVEANTKDRMRAKEASSAFLASKATDGTPFVRSDRRKGWDELVPAPVRETFESRCATALAGAGYAVAAPPAGSLERR